MLGGMSASLSSHRSRQRANPLLKKEPPPVVGRLSPQPVSTPPPPACEPDVILPGRCAVHQLDHRVADAFVRPAAAEYFHQRSLRAGRVAEAEEHDSEVR